MLRSLAFDWIGPHQVGEKSVIGRLHPALNIVDSFSASETLRNTSVHGQVSTIDQGCDWKMVKDLHALFIGILVVKLDHLISKVEVLSHIA